MSDMLMLRIMERELTTVYRDAVKQNRNSITDSLKINMNCIHRRVVVVFRYFRSYSISNQNKEPSYSSQHQLQDVETERQDRGQLIMSMPSLVDPLDASKEAGPGALLPGKLQQPVD